MKRDCPFHPKTATVAINIADMVQEADPLVLAIGHLELLFNFTARFAPAGDIGKWADAIIEKHSLWRGQPGGLVAALLQAGYLEEHAKYRLVVHDWPEHCDGAVQKYLADHTMTFWDGSKPFHRRGGKGAVTTPLQQGCDPVATELSSPSQAKPSQAKPNQAEYTPLPPQGEVEGFGANEILKLWNEKAKALGLPGCSRLTPGLRRQIVARLRENPGREFWERVLDTIGECPHLRGEGDSGWRMSLDWLVKNGENARRVAEGQFKRAAKIPAVGVIPPGQNFGVEGEAQQPRRWLS